MSAELRIGDWSLDSRNNELRRGAETVRLEPKVIEVLAHLARHAGTAVSREELLSTVWPGVIVGDDALTQAIIKLRKALGDDAHDPKYIETIPKRGYRLIALVSDADRGTAPERNAVFLSHASQDADSAQLLCEALRAAGIGVWFDRKELRGGEKWDASIRQRIKDCALFVPVISANTEARAEGYFRLEWKLAVDRSHLIADDRPFLLPVVIDETAEASARVPDRFREVQWSRLSAPGDARAFAERVSRLLALSATKAPAIPEAAAPAPSLPPEPRRLGVTQAIGLLLAGFVAAAALVSAVRMPWPIAPDIHGAARPAVSLPVVAVLPLVDLGAERKREYFSDGVTEDIIAALGRFSGIRVMSRNAVQGFKGNVSPLAAVREQLGARYIVQGSVRESAGKLRVAVELSDAEKGVLLWADRYDGEGTELFAIQDRIVRNIVGALHVKLTQIEQARVFSKPTESLEAYDLVLRAKSLVAKTDRRSNREARALLVRARELAPEYGEIDIALGEAEIQRALYGWVEDPAEPMRHAEELAKRALNRPDTRGHPRAHYLLSRVYSNLDRSEDALLEAERAIEGNPSDSTTLYWRGVSLLYVGKVDEGLAVMESARRLDPLLNEGNGFNLATGYFTAGRYRESLELADQLAVRFPRDIALHTIRAANYSELGDLEKARGAAEEVRRLNPYFNVDFTGTRFVNPAHRRKLQEALRKAGL